MFFGKKLKELRLKHAKVGLRDFATTFAMNPSDYSRLENGYDKPSDDDFWYLHLIEGIGIGRGDADEADLWALWKEPFVTQMMDKGVLLPHPFVHTADGIPLSPEKRKKLQEFLEKVVEDHNEKADKYDERTY